MSKNNDLYSILGISSDASPEDIKKAYKTLAKKYHPDINPAPNAIDKFKEVNTAYETLSDPKKKQLYDQFGQTDHNNYHNESDFSNFRSSQSGFGNFFSDFFDNFGDQSTSRRSYTKNENEEDEVFGLKISFKESMLGCSKTIKLNFNDWCLKCNKTGAISSKDIVSCYNCRGQGVEQVAQKTHFGIFQTTRTCQVCRGAREIIKNKCTKCNGAKKFKRNEQITIEIPKGIENNQILKVNQSLLKTLDINVNIFLKIIVSEDIFFKRIRNDLYITLDVSYIDIILGSEVEIPTIDGVIISKIPSSVNHKQKIRIKNQGSYIIDKNNLRGDLYVELNLKIPQYINNKTEQLLREINKEGFSPNKDFIKNFKKTW